MILRGTNFLKSNCEQLLLYFHRKVVGALWSISLLDKIYMNQQIFHHFCLMAVPWISSSGRCWEPRQKCTPFLINNSIFYLSHRLLKEDVNFRLKVANKVAIWVAKKIWFFATQNVVTHKYDAVSIPKDVYKTWRRCIDVL